MFTRKASRRFRRALQVEPLEGRSLLTAGVGAFGTLQFDFNGDAADHGVLGFSITNDGVGQVVYHHDDQSVNYASQIFASKVVGSEVRFAYQVPLDSPVSPGMIVAFDVTLAPGPTITGGARYYTSSVDASADVDAGFATFVEEIVVTGGDITIGSVADYSPAAFGCVAYAFNGDLTDPGSLGFTITSNGLGTVSYYHEAQNVNYVAPILDSKIDGDEVRFTYQIPASFPEAAGKYVTFDLTLHAGSEPTGGAGYFTTLTDATTALDTGIAGFDESTEVTGGNIVKGDDAVAFGAYQFVFKGAEDGNGPTNAVDDRGVIGFTIDSNGNGKVTYHHDDLDVNYTADIIAAKVIGKVVRFEYQVPASSLIAPGRYVVFETGPAGGSYYLNGDYFFDRASADAALSDGLTEVEEANLVTGGALELTGNVGVDPTAFGNLMFKFNGDGSDLGTLGFAIGKTGAGTVAYNHGIANYTARIFASKVDGDTLRFAYQIPPDAAIGAGIIIVFEIKLNGAGLPSARCRYVWDEALAIDLVETGIVLANETNDVVGGAAVVNGGFY